jgi:membrane-bound serine protease (ClpP class)
MWTKLLAILTLLGSMTAPSFAAGPTTEPSSVAIVSLHGEVDNYSRDLLMRQVNEAKRLGAKTIILDLDTYGGLVVSGLDISQFLRGQDDVHVIAYVRKAISAGAMIAVSCNEIVMAPSAVIGDCAPIVFGEDNKLENMDAANRAKAQSPVVSDFDASADRNGYDRQLLESMVITERVVYWVENSKTHERKFVDEAGYTKLTARGWEAVPGVPVPVDGADSLLTVHTEEAVKLGLATGIASSPQVLAQQRGLKIVADLSPGSGEKIIEFLNNGVVRSILSTTLFISLWIFLGSPGHGLAEACAVVSLGLLLGVPLLAGYANWWEVVAIFGGLALLAFEVFVFPGHGASAITGIVLILGGLLLTFVGPEPGNSWFPQTPGSWENLRTGAMAITGSLVGSLVLGALLQPYLPRLPLFRRLILTTTSGGGPVMRNTADVLPANAWPGIGTAGVAVTDLRPGGSAEFLDLSVNDNRTIAVVSESGYVNAGTRLVVREAQGNRIVVRPIVA